VIQQLSSQPRAAGPGCCISGEQKSYTAMYSNVPCMVYKYPISYIKVYTFLSLYIQVHRRIYFRGKVYTGIYRYIRFRSILYHSIVQVPLKSYIPVYPSIYLDIPYFGQVVGIPDASSHWPGHGYQPDLESPQAGHWQGLLSASHVR
jgi:hypothetical protein